MSFCVHSDEYWMNRALALAQEAARRNEVPVGALLVCDDTVIGEGFNQPILSLDATAHAEICAIRQAGQIVGNYRLPGATLYVTIEPCTMCVGAMVHARIDRLVFGAPEPKSGAVVSASRLLDHPAMNHKVEYLGGILSGQCAGLMSDFFARRRQEKKRLKQQG
ncbi:MAG: tRNA adenosine(34) deaminase TadA [Gammaproteobacteria bacterium]|nr:MAG: tRNA adenosine(34) deaminase TadA [Pseudomonadota bacterium]PIE37993.1 MAG: tRNA adenosine(34) deaminase TadA [Gammaproteobacteria bacterium]